MPFAALIVFPGMIINLDVGRDRSIKAVETAMATTKRILLVTQKAAEEADPTAQDLYGFGVVAEIKQMLKMPNGAMRILVEGLYRVEVISVIDEVGMNLEAHVEVKEDTDNRGNEVEALKRMLVETFEQWVLASKKVTSEVMLTFKDQPDAGRVADMIGGYLTIDVPEKEKLLEAISVKERLHLLYTYLCKELEIVTLEKNISQQVRKQIEQNQREYYLREQMKAISKELNEGDEKQSEVDEYKAKMAKLNLPEEVKKALDKELDRLLKMPPMMAESAVIRSYLDTCLSLPWGKMTQDNYDIKKAAQILDKDHYGLKKVKERILDYLAVRALTKSNRGPIICLVGPPGVGKTSLAQSIARAVNRKFTRISLGGVRDEAEIRGHRKTYIGAMPGRIISAIKQAGSNNPLLLLDEIDKLASDIHGDPSSALLEVLDGEQNGTFRDNFLELPFDLSDVLFVTTANTTSTIPRPLLDRMEVIELSSYTDEEKLQIAKQHLLPKQLKRHGLKKSQVKLTDDAIRELIVSYTRESGVRVLERELGALCRKVAMGIVSEEYKQAHVTGDNLEQFLGPRKFHPEKNGLENQVGLVNGLAWTAVGGTLLEAEANVIPGSGKVELTGNLGNVMKESARAAFTYIRSRAVQLGIEASFYKEKDIHVHFPEGAVPKDGPSAGVTITTAMVSALTGIPVRGDVAMTGEVTLRGRVLPIGGLREKSMAALRNGIHTVIIPKDNEPDLEEIDQTVRSALQFIPVDHVDQVLANALERPPLAQPDQAGARSPCGPETGSTHATIPQA